MPAQDSTKKKGKKAKKVTDPVALERARIEEAERHHRQLAMLRARLSEILEQERQLSESARNAVEARWITFLRECKHRELVEEIEVLRREYEAALDRKTAAAYLLTSDLDDAEEQYRQLYRSHMETVDSLVALQNRHMSELQAEFESDLLQMKGDFDRERAELERHHQIEISDLQLILQNMAAEAQLLEKKLQEEVSEVHETAAEKMDEERKQMQADLIKASETIRGELDARYKDFMATAQANMKDYMELSKEDQETTERIAAQLKKIDKLQESVTAWRTNLSRNAQEWEQRNRALQAERDATVGHLKALKDSMQKWRQKQARGLAELVKDGNAAEKSLEGTAQRAERILRLVELCKPLETEREQVLSFDAQESPADVEHDVQRRTVAAESGVEDAGATESRYGVTAEAHPLDRFWTKYNKVALDNAAIAQERVHLQRENQQLQQLLRQYLDDISVNDHVMQSSNALLTTGQAPTVVQFVGQRSVRDAGQSGYNLVIEGNKVLADAMRQTAPRR